MSLHVYGNVVIKAITLFLPLLEQLQVSSVAKLQSKQNRNLAIHNAKQ